MCYRREMTRTLRGMKRESNVCVHACVCVEGLIDYREMKPLNKTYPGWSYSANQSAYIGSVRYSIRTVHTHTLHTRRTHTVHAHVRTVCILYLTETGIHTVHTQRRYTYSTHTSYTRL